MRGRRGREEDGGKQWSERGVSPALRETINQSRLFLIGAETLLPPHTLPLLLTNITWCIITPAKTWKMTPLRRLSIKVSLKFSLTWIQSRSRNMQPEESRAVWMFYWKLPDADLLMKVGWEGSLRQGEDLGHDALKGLVVTNKQI